MQIQTLMMAEGVFDRLEEGKMCTIRNGIRDIKKDLLFLESVEEHRKQLVNVVGVIHCQLQNVPQEYIHNDGFVDKEDMLNQMRNFYPDIQYESIVTVVEFEITNILYEAKED